VLPEDCFQQKRKLVACVQGTTASFLYIAEGSSLTGCYAVSTGKQRF